MHVLLALTHGYSFQLGRMPSENSGLKDGKVTILGRFAQESSNLVPRLCGVNVNMMMEIVQTSTLVSALVLTGDTHIGVAGAVEAGGDVAGADTTIATTAVITVDIVVIIVMDGLSFFRSRVIPF